MAKVKNKALFFTTSPRSPSKMIPEIKLLSEKFSNRVHGITGAVGFF